MFDDDDISYDVTDTLSAPQINYEGIKDLHVNFFDSSNCDT